MDTDIDSEEFKPSKTYTKYYNDYIICCNLDDYTTSNVRSISCIILKQKEQVGSLEGYLIKRKGHLCTFYEDCDSLSDELQSISNFLFHINGRLRKDMWSELSAEEIEDSSSGGFLSIFMIKIEKAHRGNDLGFECIKFLMKCLNEKWTISVVELSYFNGTHIQNKKEHIYQLFSRFGYKQNSVKHLDYWYLIRGNRKFTSAMKTRNIRYTVLERTTPYVFTSQMDKLITLATIQQRSAISQEGNLRDIIRFLCLYMNG